MRNFSTRLFGQACNFLSERITLGQTTYPVEEYSPNLQEASILLHPPDRDWRSLAIWSVGKLKGIAVNPLHCSISYCLNDKPIYADYTMDGVIVVDQPYREVVGYIKFELLPIRNRIITNRLMLFTSLATRINPWAAYPFLFGGVPEAIVCTSFINWLLYTNPRYVSIEDLCDIVLAVEVFNVHKHEGIPKTRTLPAMPLV